MLVIADRSLLAHRADIVSFAAAQRLPTMYPYRGYVDAGGLMAYAPIDVEQFRQAAGAVNKILRGTKPADIPVEEPTRYGSSSTSRPRRSSASNSRRSCNSVLMH
jgi:putative ABC transport system substrate-binding protein